MRLIGNVDYGADIKLDELREFYDAVIFSTGAPPTARSTSRASTWTAATAPRTSSPGTTATRTCRDRPLTRESIAVLGVGNVALDVARILAKTADGC